MGEYGGIAAAMATLVASLTVAFTAGYSLPTIDAKATSAVTAAATKKHVSGAEAKAAYANAPFRKPVLRYLYAMAWVSAASDKTKCHAQLLLGGDPKAAAAAAIKRSPKMVARVKAAHITISQASTALARGLTDGCG